MLLYKKKVYKRNNPADSRYWVNSSKDTKMFEKLPIVNLLLLMIMAESYQSDFCEQEGNILKCLSISEISSVNSYKHVEVTLSSVQIMPPAIIVFCIVTLFFRPGSD